MDKYSQIAIEATLTPLQGKEWDITVIGESDKSPIVTVNGRKFLSSTNGKLYSIDALKNSVPLWEGVQVYDNHQGPKEFEETLGMRSPLNEWVGVITKPYWDEATNRIRAKLKIIENRLAEKLKNAYESGVLNAIGLSVNTFPQYGDAVYHEGKRLPIIEGFKQILSLDVVGNPAAGGAFNRLLAAHSMEKNTMDEETVDNGEFVAKAELEKYVSDAVTAALAAKAEEAEELDVEELDDEEVAEALAGVKKSKIDKQVLEAKTALGKIEKKAEQAQREADLARTELMVTNKLGKAHLPDKFAAAVAAQFAGRVVEAAAIDKAIQIQREAYASLDPSGRVQNAGGGHVVIGVEQDERVELEFMRRIMGNEVFNSLDQSEDPSVKARLLESKAFQSWKNNGKPELPRYNRVSNLLYEWFGGDPLLDGRAMEAATTSSLATVVKNTVNIMAANSYSQRELWFERIVRTMEVDTIDDATLARIYGTDTLDVVPEGAAYTEMNLADDEETAVFVKRGNYIEVTLETLMRDKISYVQRIPQILADAWYNTQADLVSAVFTANSHTGPVLADSGALFNATALATPGGHANLLTTALSHPAYSTARTAMMKHTDQPLGAGRRLLIQPKYLLVPVDLESEAMNIRNSELVPEADGSSTTGNQTRNQFQGQFEIVVVPTWTDATNWALVADPMQHPAIWLIYPRGQRTPQIFTADSAVSGTMFTNDTIRFKARLMTYRFSATYDTAPVSDFRPLHKSNVAG